MKFIPIVIIKFKMAKNLDLLFYLFIFLTMFAKKKP